MFNKTNGMRHRDAIPSADKMFTELAQASGWDVFITDNAAVHNPDVLARFQLVIWNNVTGDVLTHEQRESLKQWIEAGGGWIGVHATGGDVSYDWEWYVQTLLGAQFVGHTMKPKYQDADLFAVTPGHPLTGDLPTPWRIANEEWYAFDANPRDKGYEVLVTIDENSYATHGDISLGWYERWTDRMPGEHPLVWRHSLRAGRVFYSAIGHQPETYQLPEYRQLLRNAMQWALKSSGSADPESN